MNSSENIFDWGLSALTDLAQTQPDLVRNALNALFQRDGSLRWALLVTAYTQGTLSLNEVAELLNISQRALLTQFRLLGIPLIEEQDYSTPYMQCGLG